MSANSTYKPSPNAAIQDRYADTPVAPVRRKPRTISRPRPKPASSPVSRPRPIEDQIAFIEIERQLRPVRVPSRSRVFFDAVGIGLAKLSLFAGVFAVTYGVAALAGGVSVEGARRQGLTAKSRADEAVKYTATVRDHVESLTNAEFIDQWAASHGMVDGRAVMPPTASHIVEATHKPHKFGRSHSGVKAIVARR